MLKKKLSLNEHEMNADDLAIAFHHLSKVTDRCYENYPQSSKLMKLLFKVDPRSNGSFTKVRHLLDEEFLRLGRGQVEAILVHEHLHVLDPHLPGFFRYVFVNLLADRVPVERRLIETGHLALELHAKDLSPSRVLFT